MRHMKRHVPKQESKPKELDLADVLATAAPPVPVQEPEPEPEPEPELEPEPEPSAPTPPPVITSTPEAAAAKLRHKRIAAKKTPIERRRYLQGLFSRGRFDGLKTAWLLSQIWDDLGPIEFAELVSQSAIELNFRRGSAQTRRVALLGKVEMLFSMAVKNKDLRAATRLLETWLKLDVPVDVDLMSAVASTAAWPLVARELQQHNPDAFERVYGVLSAEEARKRQALAPTTIDVQPANE